MPQTYRIAYIGFGYQMFASTSSPVAWSDRGGEAVEYDENGDPCPQWVRLTHWRAVAKRYGLNPADVVIVPATACRLESRSAPLFA